MAVDPQWVVTAGHFIHPRDLTTPLPLRGEQHQSCAALCRTFFPALLSASRAGFPQVPCSVCGIPVRGVRTISTHPTHRGLFIEEWETMAAQGGMPVGVHLNRRHHYWLDDTSGPPPEWGLRQCDKTGPETTGLCEAFHGRPQPAGESPRQGVPQGKGAMGASAGLSCGAGLPEQSQAGVSHELRCGAGLPQQQASQYCPQMPHQGKGQRGKPY